MAGGMGWVSLHAELGCPGSAEPQLGEFFPSLLECGRIFSGFEMREVVGGLWRRRAGGVLGALSPSSASVFSLTA